MKAMLTCFKGKEHHELERLTTEIANLRADIQGLKDHAGISVQSQSSHAIKSTSVNDTKSTDRKEKSTTDGGMVNPDDCDVMISLNCKTMLPTAQRLRTFLEARGVKVWLCTNMAAGADFRDEIIAAVDSCEYFIPLINEAWCESKECKYEFNYCFRKNLTSEPQCPSIIPMCFPDLQWNAHAHVRALLANTNALVYDKAKEEELLNKLLYVFRSNGLETTIPHPSNWTSYDCQKFINEMIMSSFEKSGKEFDGKSILSMNSDTFEDVMTSAIKNAKQKLDELEEEAAKEDLCMTDSVSTAASSVNIGPYDGMYKVIAKTTNYYDCNVTKSNVFVVTLQRNGVGSSGCTWNAGTIHNNYDGVTSVWQGQFSSSGSFYFTSMYSNDTIEQYSGRFERCGGDDQILYARGKNSKYAWFGYGNESYGMLDMMMCKLSPSEAKKVKAGMQSLAIGDSSAISLEAIMQHIGPTMSWSDFHSTVDSYPYDNIHGKGFCSTPAYNETICLGAPIAVDFDLPVGYSDSDNCIVSIISKGEEKINDNAYFYANEYTVTRGYVFPKEKVPSLVGQFEIALFTESGQKIGFHPITITHENTWK